MTWTLGAVPTPLVCGHRGAAAVVAENTLASFAAAVERGATWVEFDVRPTADGELVIHHDPITGDGIHIGTSPRHALDVMVPRLADLATAQPSVGFDLEMKTDDIAMALGDFVDLVIAEIDRDMGQRELLVTSFDVKAIELVRQRRSDIATGLLFHDRPHDWAIATALDVGHTVIAPWYRLVTPELVAAAHERGLGVATWTVNEPATVRAVAMAGVDMVIGDDPAVIVAALAAIER